LRRVPSISEASRRMEATADFEVEIAGTLTVSVTLLL
jgi:hypothetical protein